LQKRMVEKEVDQEGVKKGFKRLELFLELDEGKWVTRGMEKEHEVNLRGENPEQNKIMQAQ